MKGALAYVPNPLPPEIGWTSALMAVQSKADQALGRLSGVGQSLANPHLLIRPFMRREAVLSSLIEGTVAGLPDLFLFEANDAVTERAPDVAEVYNYVEALEYGIHQLKRRPITLNLIREMHERLMSGVRGEEMRPGEFRSVQNWIGRGNCPIERARYVPPPPGEYLSGCLDALEKYMNGPTDLPRLARLAIIHYQFEAIHPFMDGNGRAGRLLITLLLCHDKLLPQPLLYLSAYFERNRQAYYDHLLGVSTDGAWNDWIAFFLEGVREQSLDAIHRANSLLSLRDEYRRSVQRRKVPARLLDLVDQLFATPVVKISDVTKVLGVTPRTALSYVDKLVDLKVLREVTGRQRGRLFSADGIIRAVDAPAAPTQPE